MGYFEFKFTFEDGSEALAHHGVKGMKWGERKADENSFDPLGTMGSAVNNYLVNPLMGLFGGQQQGAAPADAAQAQAEEKATKEVLAETPAPKFTEEQRNEIADAVIRGDYGNGEDRVKALTDAGYDYDTIQTRVNEKVWGLPEGSLDQQSQEQSSEDKSERTGEKKEKKKSKKKQKRRLNDDTGQVEVIHSMTGGPIFKFALEDGSEAIAHYGVKGMKHGKHVKANDPSYLLSLGLISPQQAAQMQANMGGTVGGIADGVKQGVETVKQGMQTVNDGFAKAREFLNKENEWEQKHGITIPQLQEKYNRAYNDPRNDAARERLKERYSKANVSGVAKGDDPVKRMAELAGKKTQDQKLADAERKKNEAVAKVRKAAEDARRKVHYEKESALNKDEFLGDTSKRKPTKEDMEGYKKAQDRTDAYYGKKGTQAQIAEVHRRRKESDQTARELSTMGYEYKKGRGWVMTDQSKAAAEKAYKAETQQAIKESYDHDERQTALGRVDAYYGKKGRKAQREEMARRDKLHAGSDNIKRELFEKVKSDGSAKKLQREKTARVRKKKMQEAYENRRRAARRMKWARSVDSSARKAHG